MHPGGLGSGSISRSAVCSHSAQAETLGPTCPRRGGRSDGLEGVGAFMEVVIFIHPSPPSAPDESPSHLPDLSGRNTLLILPGPPLRPLLIPIRTP